QTKPLAGQISPLVQRQVEPEDEEEKKVQAKRPDDLVQRQEEREEEEETLQAKSLVQRVGPEGGDAVPQLEQSLVQARGNGRPLAEGFRGRMESAFGADFSSVRIHSDEQSDRLSRSIQARAFTRGHDIFLRQGEYQPASAGGQRLLAHELTHVVQQNSGAVQRAQMQGRVTPHAAGQRDTGTPKTIMLPALQLFSPAVQRSPLAGKAVIQRKTVAELDAEAQPRLGHAANLDQIRQNNATMTIGATHTGDMYHLKAAKAIFPELNTLIWNVNPVNGDATVDSAFTIGSYMNDQPKTYYTNWEKPGGNKPSNDQLRNVTRGIPIAWRKWVEEGTVTSLIMYASMNSADVGATERGLMEVGTAPIGGFADEIRFNQALIFHGFRRNETYVLVNFRESGHLVGVHPALDTGRTGYDEIIAQVRDRIPGAQVVPMGEILPAGGGPFPANLVNYWTWPCCVGDRKKQAGMLRYLKENFTVLGAVGMRSGIMDMLVFAGIPIISIDISPAKPGQTSLGWERGSKLEFALGPRYGRSFIEHGRAEEQGQVAGWTGSFHEADRATIGASIGTYFGQGGGEQLAADYKDPSHPLSAVKLDALITRLTGSAPNHGGPLVPPRRAIPQTDRTYMKRIKDLLNKNYTRVPNGESYLAIIEHLLRYAQR
ncbi:MAG: DUF4157 domain-containing protein, partial [Methanothrix sp.]|nr:DUF4157 domain-containing protein [Methanothrix sp.]